MTNFLMLSFFTDIINTLFRNVPDYIRYPLLSVFIILGVWCLAKSIKKKDDKHPINFSWVILGVVFIGLAFVYIFVK